jgi:hypothetical protein
MQLSGRQPHTPATLPVVKVTHIPIERLGGPHRYRGHFLEVMDLLPLPRSLTLATILTAGHPAHCLVTLLTTLPWLLKPLCDTIDICETRLAACRNFLLLYLFLQNIYLVNVTVYMTNMEDNYHIYLHARCL